MSYHGGSPWKLEDGATAEAIQELVKGLRCNREYFRDGYAAGAYWLGSPMDWITNCVGWLIDRLQRDKALADDTELERWTNNLAKPDATTVRAMAKAAILALEPACWKNADGN